jgi:pimeloyl-ACP methyl ester carboxylesterase
MAQANVNGTQIWHELNGAGTPLFLLPGLGLDHRYYRLGEPLLRDVCTTVLVDPRGIGQSQKDDPSDVTYSAELWADDFAALARELGYAKIDVLGSSLGGSMAQALTLRHPDLVRSLIVIGAFSELDRAMEMNFSLRKKIIAKLGMSEELADFMGLSTMTREFMETDEGLAIMQANQANIQSNSPELYTAFLDAILNWGRRQPGQEGETLYTELVAGITCPTLVIVGDNDSFIPASFSKKIAEAIPGAAYAEVHDGGHIPFIEKPAETAALVKNFLTEINAAFPA